MLTDSSNSSVIYPTERKFQFSYKCFVAHQQCFWGVSEHNPALDRDKFQQLDDDFKQIIYKMAACLMNGDDVVLSRLSSSILNSITAAPVRAMFVSQEERETTHKVAYSKILDLASLKQQRYFRSNKFTNRYMGIFDALMEFANTEPTLEITLFFIMLCEKIMFAPFFATFCYLASLGNAPRVSEINEQVMRDENIHYIHARGLLNNNSWGIDKRIARRARDLMQNAVEFLIYDIVGTYESTDKHLSTKTLTEHTRYTIHQFNMDNGLYETSEELQEAETRWNTSPLLHYHNQTSTLGLKNNLMEVTSTLYAASAISATDTDIERWWMNSQLEEEEEEEEEEVTKVDCNL
jgi:ribonucleotide reductase beta subunit family protein with ferritin-like domain